MVKVEIVGRGEYCNDGREFFGWRFAMHGISIYDTSVPDNTQEETIDIPCILRFVAANYTKQAVTLKELA